MSFEVKVTSRFKRQVKQLSKKHLSLKTNLLKLITSLETNPKIGTPIGQDCYKIRLAITSKGKGKSGGARVISHVYITGKTVYLLTIFDKADQENISDKELKELLNDLF